MLPEISHEELLRLIAEKEYGATAKNAKPFIDEFCKRVIDRCCSEFSTAEINYYQNIDNKTIFMLQLQIRMARDLKKALDRAINEGEQADISLSERGYKR